MIFNYIGLICLFSFLANLYITFSNRHQLKVPFFLFSASFLSWSFCNYQTFLLVNSDFWFRLASLSSLVGLVIFLYISQLLGTRKVSQRRYKKSIVGVILLNIAYIFSPFFLENIHNVDGDLTIHFGVLGSIYFIEILGLLFGIVISLQRQRAVDSVQKKKIKYLLIGLYSTTPIPIITNLILPLFYRDLQFLNIGKLLLYIFFLLQLYPVFRYQPSVKYMYVKESISTCMMVVLTAGAFFGSVLFLEFIHLIYPVSFLLVKAIILSLLILLSYPLVARLNKRVIKWAFSSYDISYDRTIAEFSEKLKQILVYEDLVSYIFNKFPESLHLSGVNLYLRNDEGQLCEYDQHFHFFKDNESLGALNIVRFVEEGRRYLNLDELCIEQSLCESNEQYGRIELVVSEMHRLNIVMCLPLYVNGGIAGLVGFGRRHDRHYFTSDDQGLMLTMVAHISASMQNAIHYKRLNENKERITALNKTALALNESFSLLDFDSIISEALTSLFDVDSCVIYRKGLSSSIFNATYMSEDIEGNVQLDYLTSQFPLLSEAVTESKFYMYYDELPYLNHSCVNALKNSVGASSMVVMQLCHQSECLGVVLGFYKYKKHGFSASRTLLFDTFLQLSAANLQNTVQYQLLRSEKNHNEAILEHMVSGVILLNDKMIITGFNKAAEYATSCTIWEVMGKHISTLYEVSPEIKKVERLGDGKRIYSFELCLRINGKTRYYSFSANSIKVSGESSYIILLTDITRLKALQEEVNRSKRLSSLGTLAAGIAHEIKNPLVAIKTFTQLLPRKYEDPEFNPRYMSIVPPQITRIRKLCQSLLQLGDPKEPSLQLMSLEKMLNNVQDLLNSSSKKYKGTVLLDGNLDLRVVVDPEQIEQVFLNLILNGLEALEDTGQVVIRASELATGFVSVKIEDNGCGISEEQKEQLFDPFYTTKSKGTGLGMSIVHQIVSDHKGRIDVESNKGKGTTFTVHLPKEKPVKD